MVGLDHRIERWIVNHRTGWLDDVFVSLTRVGSYGGIWLVLALVFAYVRRRPEIFLFAAAADGLAEALAALLKSLVGRQRPPLVYPTPHPLVADPHSQAFPSGHAATSFACATMLSLFFPRRTAAFVALAVAIAFSRVYVGVHWPTDVLAGALLGVATALLLRVTIRWRSSQAPRAG